MRFLLPGECRSSTLFPSYSAIHKAKGLLLPWFSWYYSFGRASSMNGTLGFHAFLTHPAESSENTSIFWDVRKYCSKFYNGRLWENFFFSFWSVWDKLVIVPSFWWYIILSHSNEIRTTWRYFNYFILGKSYWCKKLQIYIFIGISPRSSDLITMRKNNIPPKTWYNYQFVPDTSKTEKKNFS